MNEEMSFEQAMSRLEEIVRILETGDSGLEKSMILYKEGATLSQFCHKKLEKARIEVEIWQNGGTTPIGDQETDGEGE